ncbi:MAG TPA: inorganic diphosphatase [Steroidobacteraceae bacterium]|nr:inorganic diphosphatase [Steroidobacteraceae bacterium]
MTESYSRWRPHPWHGLETGPDAPRIVNAYIEITPFDHMKYEVDKVSGYLRVDRPQRTSSHPPALYGFIPQTYCGERVARLAPGSDRGDGDPLDICVISERPIARPEVLLRACVVGERPADGMRAAQQLLRNKAPFKVWQHAFTGESRDGTLGYAWGYAGSPGAAEPSSVYVNVWRRPDAAAPWRLVVQSLTPIPP